MKVALAVVLLLLAAVCLVSGDRAKATAIPCDQTGYQGCTKVTAAKSNYKGCCDKIDDYDFDPLKVDGEVLCDAKGYDPAYYCKVSGALATFFGNTKRAILETETGDYCWCDKQ